MSKGIVYLKEDVNIIRCVPVSRDYKAERRSDDGRLFT